MLVKAMEFSGDEGSGRNITIDDFELFVENMEFIKAWKEYQKCTEWNSFRVFVEFYLFFTLIGNIYAVYVIIRAFNTPGTAFFNWMRLVNALCAVVLCSLLLVYPFSFAWSTRNHFALKFDEEQIDHYVSNRNGSEALLGRKNHAGEHSCGQSGLATCKVPGFVLGIVIYLPFVATSMTCFNVVMATFCWKMYKLRTHTISTIRLTVFLCLSLTVVICFALPAMEVGAHYHYDVFLKVCWLPTRLEVNMEKRFVFFSFGFLSIVVFLLLMFGYMLVKAINSEEVTYRNSSGSKCSIFFAQCTLIKSASWRKQSTTTAWMSLASLIIYIPISVGYILKFTLISPDDMVTWFQVMTYVSTLCVPSVPTLISLSHYKPYRKISAEVFGCCNKPIKKNRQVVQRSPHSVTYRNFNNRVSPLTVSDSSQDGEVLADEYPRYHWGDTNRSFIVERFRAKSDRDASMSQWGAQMSIPDPGERIETPESRAGYEDWSGGRRKMYPGLGSTKRTFDDDRRRGAAPQEKDRRIPAEDRSPFLRRESSIPRKMQRYWRQFSDSRLGRRRHNAQQQSVGPGQAQGQRYGSRRNVTFAPSPAGDAVWRGAENSPRIARDASLSRSGSVRRNIERFMMRANLYQGANQARRVREIPHSELRAEMLHNEPYRGEDKAYPESGFHPGRYTYLQPPAPARPTGDKLSDESQVSLREPESRFNPWEQYDSSYETLDRYEQQQQQQHQQQRYQYR